MRKLCVVLAAAIVAVFGANAAKAIANPSSWWSGSGLISVSVQMGPAKETIEWSYSSSLFIDKTTIDFGSVRPGGTQWMLPVDFETGKTTNTRASTQKNPNTERRERNRALAASLYGLQRVRKTLDHDDLGDATIDADSITVGGGMTAVSHFNKVTGSVTMKYTGTMTSGPRMGEPFKGKVKVTFKGNRM